MEIESPERESEFKASVDDSGNVVLKRKVSIKRGKKSKAKGGQFEMRVRKDLEAKGWIVDKWSNNVDLVEGKLVPAKRKFNPFNKVLTIGTGFPDFVCFQEMGDGKYKVIGVEVKINGLLSREEKQKCEWLVSNRVFSEILLAKKRKEGRNVVVEYVDFDEILGRMR